MDVAGIAAFGSAATALAGSLALPVLERSGMRDPIVNLVTVALAVLAIAMLGVTFTNDDYLNDGRSVWDISDGRRRLLLISAVMLAAAGALLSASARRRRALTVWVPLATLLIVAVNYTAIASTLE